MRNTLYTIIAFLCLPVSILNAREVVVVSKKRPIESQLTRPRVEYVIRIPIDLNGDRLVVPDNCTLRFTKNGCLLNGTLVGRNTEVISNRHMTFKSIAIEGTYATRQSIPEWFADEDDGVRIEKAIQIADTVKLKKKYLPNQTIHINSPTVLIGRGQIEWGAQSACLVINSNRVSLGGITLKTTNKKAVLLQAVGSEEKPLKHIIIERCSIRGGMIAIRCDFVEESLITHNRVYDVDHTGIGLYSCHNVDVTFNHISDVNLKHNFNNSYGVAASFHYGDPKSSEIRINDNVVANNPYWEALDTHGGERIEFCRNTVKNCWRGVAAVSDDHRNQEICSEIVIINNCIECSDEPRSNGIVFTGLTETSLAMGWIITGNVIKNAVIGFYSNYTSDAIVKDNDVTVVDEGWRDRGSVCLSFSSNTITIVGKGESQYKRCGLYLIPSAFNKSPFGEINNNHIIANDNIGVLARDAFKSSISLIDNTIETKGAKYMGGDNKESSSLRLHYFTEIIETFDPHK